MRTAEDASGLSWREAIAIVRDVASALRAREEAGRAGKLHPACVALEGDRVDVAALARAMDERAGAAEAVGPWTPPEQAAGAPWDAAANRYVLGLIAYRLIAGEHPFGGAGLRHALAGQRFGAPPFEAHVAARTRPGVQALVLSMLDPDPRGRPRDAGAIERRCEELLAPRASGLEPRPAAANAGPGPRPGAEDRVRVRGGERGRGSWSVGRGGWLAAGIAVAIALASLSANPSPSAKPNPNPNPIALATSLPDARPASCSPCHAREVAEWSRSVMAHSATSPLFGALESLVEEQVGRDDACPDGAGALRRASTFDPCFARNGLVATGAGGEGWCVNCHAPLDSIAASAPAWRAHGGANARAPLIDRLAPSSLEGIACGVCHQAIGPVEDHARAAATRAYEGNATWRSLVTGATFLARPEDAIGLRGIANSGYSLDPASFLARGGAPHRAPTEAMRAYGRSSEACGACHDVRLFGTDALGGARGEHFKRLRNAYSEWRAWSESEARAGRVAPSCQGCHMSLYPGACEAGGAGGEGCPSGTHFVAHAPGDRPLARVAPDSDAPTRVASHAFAAVDVPLSRDLEDAAIDDRAGDPFGAPLGLRARRDLLLSRAMRMEIDGARLRGRRIAIPIVLENVGAGHRVPAGFSQEREIWVALDVVDADGRLVYRVGHLDAPDEDLRDKVFVRVNVGDDRVDRQGRPLGVFGADVVDGPDVPRWSPPPGDGATTFRGRGLVNLQNGFLRCVRCVGAIDASGACVAIGGQGRTRADRFDDGDYDADTGECRSNLDGARALLETYFPVGALDASRGITKAPDAIIDTRSAPPGVPLTYEYELDARGFRAPFRADARLLFRAFPPYLVRAFARYEARMSARGLRPSGPQVDESMLRRIDVVEIARAEARIE